jgi:NDP-sugar pyrophosphorylase family protein
VKAGIIAAGDGSRLRSEGITLPKPLVLVDGVPLIERLIRSYARCGISEIVCIVNEYSLQVKEYVEAKEFPIHVGFVVKTTPSSMHSLFELSPHLADGQFLLSTVDSIFNEGELSSLLEYARLHQSVDGILAVTDFVDDENPLYVELDPARRITAFRKSERKTWVTGGLYVFAPRIFREIEAMLNSGTQRLRNFLGHLLLHGYRLEGFPFSKIVDVDHVHDIVAAEEMLRGKS